MSAFDPDDPSASTVLLLGLVLLRDGLTRGLISPSHSAFLLDRNLRDLGGTAIEVCGDEMTHCNGADAQRD